MKFSIKMHDEDTNSWNAIIVGYVIHGYRKDKLKSFDLHDEEIVSWK